ncbi:organic cation transporter protein [Galendromus occidentalis]|uniref:Organic cation transporter protein n=1 Tax=Galendromus occidentalis TaxID=34638 RepID=A0AAJ7SGY9_9ACAR|nr:organic cation transporter protein [Galendromus occidentalis]
MNPLDVSTLIGTFGRYQFLVMMVTVLRAFPTSWTLTSIDFIAGDVDHWCAPPNREVWNQDHWKATAIPSKDGKQSRCQHHRIVNGQLWFNETVDCADWEYDEAAPSSALVEWHLVCGRDWMRSAMQSVTFVGQFFGALIIGRLADQYGRRYMLNVSSVCMFIFAVLGSFSPTVHIFNMLRFVQAVAVSGLQTTSAALFTEISLPRDRNLLNIGFSLGFTVPMILLPFLAYGLDNWRAVQAAAGLSTILMLPVLVVLEESPRWLLSKGRISDAKSALTKIFRMNRRQVPDLEAMVPALLSKVQADSATGENAGLKEIWKHRNLRKNVLFLFAFWFLENLFYFSNAFLATRLGGSRFVSFSVSAAAEIPGGLLSIYIIRHMARRKSLFILLILAALAASLLAVLSPELFVLRLGLNMTCRFLLVMTTAIKWVYTFEVLPTQARSFGFACCYCFGRVGGMIAPFMRDLFRWKPPVPFAILGTCAILAALILKFLPETLNVDLPDSFSESDKLGEKEKNEKSLANH